MTKGSGGLFSGRRAADQILIDRELMLRQTEERAQEAEQKVADLQAELEALRTELEEAKAASTSPASEVARFLDEELGSVMKTAQEAATAIVERANAAATAELAEARATAGSELALARSTAAETIAESERLRGEIEQDRAVFIAWREQAEPAIRSAQAKIDEFRQSVGGLAERIAGVLSPIDDSITGMEKDLNDVLAVPAPPELKVPEEGAKDEAAPAPVAEAEPAAPADVPEELSTAQEETGAEVIDLTKEEKPAKASRAKAR
jgi:predicted  nucleic acid-binding Zn-ribbon protein